jgi:hypothetical protein
MGVKIRSKAEGMRARGITKIGIDQDVIDMYQTGLSQKQIAKHFNLKTGDSVGAILDKHNINEGNKGLRNASWKGGITPLNNEVRSSAQYIAFRDAKFKVSNYHSEISDLKPVNVNLHHIVEFNFIMKNFVNKDNWQKSKELWNDNNVIVLSEDEHRAIHQNQKINIDFKRFIVKHVDRQSCALLLKQYHYLGTLPKNTKHIYGLFINNSLVGCCVFGQGANRHLSSGVGGKALELTRLCMVDWLPKNTGTYFLSKVIKQLRKQEQDLRYLVSFADPNNGHIGTIYKAANWKYTGQCKVDYSYKLIDGSIVHKSKFRCKNGFSEKQLASNAGAQKIAIKGKHRYIYQM